MIVTKSSLLLDDHRQRDGSIWVTETHFVEDAEPLVIAYLCAPKDDPKAIMARHVADIEAEAPPMPPDPVITALDDAKAAYMAGDVSAADLRLDDVRSLTAAKSEARRG